MRNKTSKPKANPAPKSKSNPKSNPESSTRAPRKIATTVATGSKTQGERPAKTKIAASKPIGRGATEDVGLNVKISAQVNTLVNVEIQDFVGAALLMLPAGLRAALGDKHLHSNALELATKEILVIVREAGVVAYVHLPIIVKELEASATELRHGVILRDITESPKKQDAMRRSSAAKQTPTKGAGRRSHGA